MVRKRGAREGRVGEGGGGEQPLERLCTKEQFPSWPFCRRTVAAHSLRSKAIN